MAPFDSAINKDRRDAIPGCGSFGLSDQKGEIVNNVVPETALLAIQKKIFTCSQIQAPIVMRAPWIAEKIGTVDLFSTGAEKWRRLHMMHL